MNNKIALSGWAVHEWIGNDFHNAPEAPLVSAALGKLAELPERARAAGFDALEIPHFQLPVGDHEIARFRELAGHHGIELFQLLIDNGDISDPDRSEKHLGWVETWIDIAARAGFQRVRVIAGKQEPTPGAVDRAVYGLSRLAEFGAARGVGVSTENWFALMKDPTVVHHVLDRCETVGLVFDFGNWPGPNKYEHLTAIANRATSAHAKCDYRDGRPLSEDFERCVRILETSDFTGPYTLVHPESGREWEAVEEQLRLLKTAIPAAQA